MPTLKYKIEPVKKDEEGVLLAKEIIPVNGSFIKQTLVKKWGFELTAPDKTWYEAAKHIATCPDCKTLEIGAASGPFPTFVRDTFEESLSSNLSFLKGYWAIDPDQQAIEQLHKNIPEIPQNQLISGVLEQNTLKKFGKTKFDVIVVSRVFHFLSDEQMIDQLRLISECLAPHGVIFLSGLTTALYALRIAYGSKNFTPEISSCGTVTVNLYELNRHTQNLIPVSAVEAHQKSEVKEDSGLTLRNAYAWSQLIQEAGFYTIQLEKTSYYDTKGQGLFLPWLQEPGSPPNVNCHLVIHKNRPNSPFFFRQVECLKEEKKLEEKKQESLKPGSTPTPF